MRLTYLTILLFVLNSCVTDNSEKKDWFNCKRQATVQAYFNYALNHNSSTYFDSTLTILNDSIKLDRFFFLIYKEDSNMFFKEKLGGNPEISKDHVFLIDINTSSCLYNDTLLTKKDSINKKLHWFMFQGFKHFIWIYSDTLSSKERWFPFFSKITEIKNEYRLERERFSKKLWQIGYDELDSLKKEQVKEKIPINMLIFFYNPNPTPPPLIIEKEK
jgi:hypothetical protein